MCAAPCCCGYCRENELTLLGNPTRERGTCGKFLAHASSCDSFKQPYLVLAALASQTTRWHSYPSHSVILSSKEHVVSDATDLVGRPPFFERQGVSRWLYRSTPAANALPIIRRESKKVIVHLSQVHGIARQTETRVLTGQRNFESGATLSPVLSLETDC
jgi:hypothetical protein